jgi:hypothetical protein
MYITENKSMVSNYIYFLKLIMKKYKIYFPNNFYTEIGQYLLPIIDYDLYKNISTDYFYQGYFREYPFDLFVSSFNLKYFTKKFDINIDKKVNISSNKKDIYTKLIIKRKIFNNHLTVYKLDIFFYSNYFYMNYKIDEFIIYIYLNNNNDILHYKTKKFSYFNNYIKYIWEMNQGLIMDDYIFSRYDRRILYYELYKKCFHKLIHIFD